MKSSKDMVNHSVNENKPNTILSMVMLSDVSSFSHVEFSSAIKKNINIYNEYLDNDVVTFNVDDLTVYIMVIEAAIPFGDIEGTAKYAYNWPKAVEDLKNHDAHIVVGVSLVNGNSIKSFKLLTNVICAVLNTTKAIGVYNGAQSLLIPKRDYINEAKRMDDENLPLNLWLYFGLRTIKSKRNGYTYGLNAFGKDEIEIIDSNKSLSEIREFLFNIAHYVLLTDVTFKSGETIGMSIDEKINVIYSKGVFVAGNSFKLDY